ncbi:MAG TPA: SRPBCC family protein [Chitinophagaceae bacterium]|nr:SRPBCC family protein [Chitinophagaceae bacterium]
MANNKTKCAEAQMLIRKPVEEVFEAFMNPAITKNFWFTKGSDRLEVDKKVTWHWEMYNISTTVVAKEILRDQKILFEWGEPSKTVEFKFTELDEDATFVTVSEYGYDKTGDELLAAIKDSTAGFTTVLDGLKAFLEHRINLNLIADKFPKEIASHGQN